MNVRAGEDGFRLTEGKHGIGNLCDFGYTSSMACAAS